LVEPGITVQRSTPEIAAATGIRAGVVVAEVFEGGPASTVLQSGDVITKTDGRPVGDPKSFLLDLGARLREGPVVVSFVRDQQVRQGELRNPERPARAHENSELKLELVRGVGAKLVSVPDNSSFVNAGLAPDDTILRIGNVGAPTPTQVSSALRDAPPGRFLLLVVRRGPRQHVTAIKKEDRSDVVTR
jgi:S1-C subfamily serine protease